MKTEFIDITPDRSLMLKLGNSGYSLDESVAEFVDNSIDAMLEKRNLRVDVEINKGRILVKDNGRGMSREEIGNALKLGASKKENQLGKFGLGMKTACLSLGKCFDIKSSEGKGFVFMAGYNQEKWLNEGRWNSFPLVVDERDEESGTGIIVSDLIVDINEKKVERLKRHLGLRFGLFVKEGELELFVNGERCKAEVPELIGKGKKNFELKLRDGNVVKGWIGFKLADSLKSSFGFHTYRNKRLITFHDKIGISLNQKSKQLVGEIHIGHIPVTHNKRGWIKESREYKAFEKEFAEFLRNYDTESVKLVEGLAASPGRVEGTVRVLNTFMIGKERGQEAYEKVKEGDIIVTQMTRPDMLFYLQKAGAIVTDYGGVLSHAAIVSREFEIPCISGTQNATELLKDGQKVIVDATEGVVYSAE